MLEAVKALIRQKNEQINAASIIFEDGTGDNLDDLIVLGEENTIIEYGTEESNPPVEEAADEAEKEDDDANNDTASTTAEDDLMDTEIDGDEKPTEKPAATAEPAEDIMNAEIDDGLPNVGANPTGEDINPDSDIMDIDIDLGTNTIKDVLPVPPANASDAIADNDEMDSQKVDSGFGDEELDDNEFDEPGPTEESGGVMDIDIDADFTEAITLGANDADGGGTAATGTEDGAVSSVDAGAAPASGDNAAAPADAGVENDVTAAIRDKVEDATSDSSTSGDASSKEALMKKLSSLTKGIEDVKQSVLGIAK